MRKFLYKNSGSIALISVLIIAAFTILIVVAMSEVNISTSYEYFNNSENKTAYYAAESCLEEAVIRLEDDPTFNSGTITFDADTNCNISVTGNQILIEVTHLDFAQNYHADISLNSNGQANNVKLLNWYEYF